jgi:flavodoxin I
LTHKYFIRKEVSDMSKIAVVYWSGTGNTEAMANYVVEGAKESGADVTLFTATEFSKDLIDDFDAFAFGCPSMGSEELEDSEFEPMFTSIESKLKGKRIALFGSYGWGDGEWMRTWEETCVDDGAILACDSVICNDAPDEEAKSACTLLGKTLVV